MTAVLFSCCSSVQLFLFPLLVVCAFAFAFACAVSVSSPVIPPDPVVNDDFPDPCAVYFDGMYYAYAGWWRMSSADLTHWSTPNTYWLSGYPSWTQSGVHGGAPSVVQVSDNQWNVYFQVQYETSGHNCIAVATNSHPKDQFQAVTNLDPLICQLTLGGSIDASARKLSNGQLVLYWKSNGGGPNNEPAQIWVANMSRNGFALTSAPIPLIHTTSYWEAHGGHGCVEGPATVHINDKLLLMYSGGAWDTDWYAVGYATCDSPYGPCQKVTVDKPWLASYNDTVGPGGQEYFADNDGQTWQIMHGWKAGTVGYNNGGKRMPRVYPLQYLEEKFGTLT